MTTATHLKASGHKSCSNCLGLRLIDLHVRTPVLCRRKGKASPFSTLASKISTRYSTEFCCQHGQFTATTSENKKFSGTHFA
jgi:hypothetical protein